MPSTNTAARDLENVVSPATATTFEGHYDPGVRVTGR
jgi:hypothetical protein